MELIDITNLTELSIKVRIDEWKPGKYIYFDSIVWRDEEDNIFNITEDLLECTFWERYSENSPRRLYKWLIADKDGIHRNIYETSFFLDSNGYSSDKGVLIDKYRLIRKMENKWIEVDKDGNILDCSVDVE